MRTNSRDRGRGRGQTFEAETEANFTRPKITFNIIMFTTQTVQYINVSSLFSFVIVIINQIVKHYHESELKEVMKLVCESKLPIPALDTFPRGQNKKFKDRPRTNVGDRVRGRGKIFEAKAEAEDKILDLRTAWPPGLNITGSNRSSSVTTS